MFKQDTYYLMSFYNLVISRQWGYKWINKSHPMDVRYDLFLQCKKSHIRNFISYINLCNSALPILLRQNSMKFLPPFLLIEKFENITDCIFAWRLVKFSCQFHKRARWKTVLSNSLVSLIMWGLCLAEAKMYTLFRWRESGNSRIHHFVMMVSSVR